MADLDRAAPPWVPGLLLPGRQPVYTEHARGGHLLCQGYEADGQSGWFKLCDLARQAVQGRGSRPGQAGSEGELGGKRQQEAKQIGGKRSC